MPHLIGPWHIAHELSILARWSCIQLGSLWLSGGDTPCTITNTKLARVTVVEAGPAREEFTELDSSIAETTLQLDQLNKDLATEESLLARQATTRMARDNLRNQRDLLKLRVDSLKQKRQAIEARYSAEDKELEKGRISELTKQVESLTRQLQDESVAAPRSGLKLDSASSQARPSAQGAPGEPLAWTEGSRSVETFERQS